MGREEMRKRKDRERDSTLVKSPAAFQDVSTHTWWEAEVTDWQSRAGAWVASWPWA